MGRGLNAEGILGIFYARDHGVVADGQVNDAAAIQATIEAARAAGGGTVVLPSDADAVAVGATVLLHDDVELVIPAGCTLRLLDGSNCDMIANADPVGGNSRIRIAGGGTIDGNRAGQTGASNGINMQNVADLVIELGLVTSCYSNGLLLTGCPRPDVDTPVTDCGSHGVKLVDVTRGLVVARSYDNSRIAVAGTCDGINLSGASTDNVIAGAICYDSAGAGGRQGYGIREAAASACDRNIIVGASLVANRTGEISLVGASSKNIDANTLVYAAPNLTLGTVAAEGVAGSVMRSDATIVAFDATDPAAQAFGDAAAVGVAPVSARRDHKHAMPANPVTAHNVAAAVHGLPASVSVLGNRAGAGEFVQRGSVTVTINQTSRSGNATITFPVGFSSFIGVLLTVNIDPTVAGERPVSAGATVVGTLGLTVYVDLFAAAAAQRVFTVYWWAIGT